MAKTNATKPETNELRHFYFRHDRGRKELMYVLVSKRIQLKSLRAVADFPIAKYGKYLIFSLFFTLFFRMLLSLSTRFSYFFFFKCGFTFSVNFRGHAIRMRFSRGTKAELWVPVIWQLNGRERVIMVCHSNWSVGGRVCLPSGKNGVKA